MTGWHLRDMALKFQISDWTALSVPLRLHARSVGLSERLWRVDAGPPPRPAGPASIDQRPIRDASDRGARRERAHRLAPEQGGAGTPRIAPLL